MRIHHKPHCNEVASVTSDVGAVFEISMGMNAMWDLR